MEGADRFGVVSGGVGTVTGIAGAILGYVAYRRSEALKALDLRLELRKAEKDLRRLIEELPSLLQEARGSRAAVLAALGLSNSGTWEAFRGRWESDVKKAEAMASALPKETNDYRGVAHEVLETRLVDVHDEQRGAEALRDEYRSHLAWDEGQRDQIRADQRSRTHAMLSGR